MAKPTWIPEVAAAQKIGYQPKTLRRYAKSGRLDISFTHINGRRFQYNEKDIEKLLNQNAHIIIN